MKFSRKQISYGAVLGVALIGLAYDQCMNGDAPKARHVPSVTAPVRVAAIMPAAPIEVTSSTPQNTSLIASRLKQLSEQVPSINYERNAFAAPPGWQNEKSASNGDAGDQQERRRQFAGSHHLRAIITQGNSGGVIVDDQLIQAGQSLDGLRLIAMDNHSARFEAEGCVITLTLPQDPIIPPSR